MTDRIPVVAFKDNCIANSKLTFSEAAQITDRFTTADAPALMGANEFALKVEIVLIEGRHRIGCANIAEGLEEAWLS